MKIYENENRSHYNLMIFNTHYDKLKILSKSKILEINDFLHRCVPKALVVNEIFARQENIKAILDFLHKIPMGLLLLRASPRTTL